MSILQVDATPAMTSKGQHAMDESTSSTESMQRGATRAADRELSRSEPLGIGGMSSVFRAVHVETNHEVALKVLTRSLAKNATLLQRFLREARSAETLEHPNIVAIYDRGIDSGRHYLVLEYVAGGDFHDYIQRQGPLSLAEAISVIKSVADGLKYAANRGLIHRDVKPSNILRTHDGQIKIIDLGLRLQNEFEDERVTREGTTVGTVDYMAPEQARDSRATSIQSDMYSLGCTFYYLLAGVPPFPGGDITDKLTRHAKNPPPDIRDLRPDLPVGVERDPPEIDGEAARGSIRVVRRFDGRHRSRTACRRNARRPGLRSLRSRIPPMPRQPDTATDSA